MMIRAVLVSAAIGLGVTAVIAQTDPIATRKALMEENGKQSKIGAAMIKGDTPFDLAAAKNVFVVFIDSAGKMPDLFPDNSKTGKTTAAPKIWEDMADFKARFAKLGADSKAALDSVKDLDSFKASFGSVGKDCGDCHELYRVKKS